MELKVCTECNQEKPLDAFPVRYDRPVGVRSKCRECANALRKKHYEADKKSGKLKEIIWGRSGINIAYDEYVNRYNDLDGRCEICKKQFDVLCVDHDHRTGKIRGLLCTPCNLAIEHLDESIEIMNNAISYMNTYGGRNV